MKHPRLALLCFIAALEKFGFNGMRSVLVLYFTKAAGQDDAQATALYGVFMALGFLTPLFGGWLADRFLGRAKAMALGASLAATGLLVLLVPNALWFNGGLAALILGAGLIKSNVTTLMGEAALAEGVAPEKAFTALYMCFNWGTLLGTIACAVVGEVYGWGYGFLTAGLPMVLATVAAFSLPQTPAPRPWLASALILAALPALGFVLGHGEILAWALPVLMVGALAAMVALSGKEGRRGMNGNLTILYFMAFHTVFFAFYEQGSTSLVLFAESHVDRSLGSLIGWGDGHTLPTTFFQTIDPLLNVILGLGALFFWRKPASPAPAISPSLKFAAGFAAMAAGFAVLEFFSPGAGDRQALLNPWFLILAYALFVAGEILVIPTGFAVVSAHAPPRHGALFMGTWFLSIAGSEWLASALARWMAGVSYAGGFQALTRASLGLASALLVTRVLGAFMQRRTNWFDFRPSSV